MNLKIKIIIGFIIAINNMLYAIQVSSKPIYSVTGSVGWTTSAVSLSYPKQNSNVCNLITSKDLRVDLPNGAIIRKAFLYWATDSSDSSILLNGKNILAQKTWSTTTGTMSFHGYRADVTNIISSPQINSTAMEVVRNP